MIKLKGPRDASSVSVGGKEYQVKSGVVEVPDEHADALARHGFKPVKQDSKSEPHK